MRKFYCQECGAQVPLEVENCPFCYSHFGSVLCPKCSYSGPAQKFYNGCPKCGYLKINKFKKYNNLGLKKFIILFSILSLIILLLISIF